MLLFCIALYGYHSIVTAKVVAIEINTGKIKQRRSIAVTLKEAIEKSLIFQSFKSNKESLISLSQNWKKNYSPPKIIAFLKLILAGKIISSKILYFHHEYESLNFY